MNIFVLDKDTYNCAKYHCDQHVGKMVLESAQLLSTAFTYPQLKGLYAKTHYNHPCAIWARQSKANYDYLVQLMDDLGEEFYYRYGREHLSSSLLSKFRSLKPEVPDGDLTPFALAMPDDYKRPCPVVSYRNYYVTKRTEFSMTWKRRSVPNWFKERM
jgi:hypothetical protein